MSLLVVGSCSKIASNLVLSLSQLKAYKTVTIADPLPLYVHHHRYYKLRKTLNEQRSSTSVSLEKIISLEALAGLVNNHDDVLHITHDYFTSVLSKHKLIEMTAQLCSKKPKVYFLAPIEYDHYGENNPEEAFLRTKEKVHSLLPQAGFIRSDVQDSSEIYSYLYKSKKIWEEVTLPNTQGFKPRVLDSNFFTQHVSQQLKSPSGGVEQLLRGEKPRHLTEVSHCRDLQEHEIAHHASNVANLVSKYKGPSDKSGTILESKFI